MAISLRSAFSATTDCARKRAIRRQIDTALYSITREEISIRKRLDWERARVSSLLGTDTDGYSTREPRDELRLRKAERQMLSASNRLTALNVERLSLEGMVELLGPVDEAPAPEKRAQARAAWLRSLLASERFLTLVISALALLLVLLSA